jgi:hypothetical protein
MARTHLRIKDLPNLDNCTFFIEYDKAPFPDTYALLEDYRPLSFIMLKNCRIIPDPDEEVDGFHVFIMHSKLSPLEVLKRRQLFRKLRYEAQQDVVREALETGRLRLGNFGLEGDRSIKVWCKDVIDEMDYHL